ncbi:MAG: hypothetical protein ACRERS_05760, partial [Methylococcales bacterium]
MGNTVSVVPDTSIVVLAARMMAVSLASSGAEIERSSSASRFEGNLFGSKSPVEGETVAIIST